MKINYSSKKPNMSISCIDFVISDTEWYTFHYYTLNYPLDFRNVRNESYDSITEEAGYTNFPLVIYED